MKNFILLNLLGLMCIAASGCAVVLVGAGVTAGIVVSKDSAELNKDVSFASAWGTTFETIKSMGQVELHNELLGKIEARVDNTRVIAKVTQVTPKTVNIKIKARKYYFPRVAVAVDILTRISDTLK